MVKGLIEQQPIGTPSAMALGGALANQPIARADFAPIAPKKHICDSCFVRTP